MEGKAVIQTPIARQLVERDYRSRLGIAAAEGERRDARLDHRAHTHRAWLERHVDLGVGETRQTEPSRRATKRQHLGVSGWILRAQRLVVRVCNDPTADDHDRADGYFAAPFASASFRQSARHRRGGIARRFARQQPDWVQTLNESPPLGSDGRASDEIGQSKRIGITRATDSLLRFYVRGNRFVSGPQALNR